MNSDEQRTNTNLDDGFVLATVHSSCCLRIAEFDLSILRRVCSGCGKALENSDLLTEEQAAQQAVELATLVAD